MMNEGMGRPGRKGRPRGPDRRSDWRLCAWCHEVIPDAKRHRRYCDGRCRIAAWRWRRRSVTGKGN